MQLEYLYFFLDCEENGVVFELGKRCTSQNLIPVGPPCQGLIRRMVGIGWNLSPTLCMHKNAKYWHLSNIEAGLARQLANFNGRATFQMNAYRTGGIGQGNNSPSLDFGRIRNKTFFLSNNLLLKFGYSEKVTKIWPIFHY